MRGSSLRDKVRFAWPEGLPQSCSHHPAPGLWLLCPPCSTWGFTQTHSKTWGGQGPKTHENNPLPFSSPRTAGCGVITDPNQGIAQLLLRTHSKCCHKGHRGCAILEAAPPVPGPQHRQWQRGNHLHLFLSLPCDMCHHYRSRLGIPEAVQRGCTPGSTQCSPYGREGAAGIHPRGPLGAEPLARQVLDRATAPRDRRPARSLSSLVVSLPAHRLPPSLCTLNKKGEQRSQPHC